jgi:hypothetical protein
VERASGKTNSAWLVVTLVVVAVAAGVVAILRLDTTGESGSGLSKDYALDLTELAKVDPNLILYTEPGPPLNTGLQQSRAIALDVGGRMYIAGDRAIRVLSNRGSQERLIELPGEPQCLTVSDDGKLYVGLRDRVEVVDAEGRPVASWASPGAGTVLTSIAKSGDDVFVADAGHRIVLHYNAAGTLIKRIGEKDPDKNVPGFVIPSPHFDLAVARDGLLRVVNPGRHRIEAYTFDGDLEFWWGERSVDIKGFCGCCNPVSLALLPDGGFVTAEKGLVRVKVYNSNGAFLGVVAGPAQLAEGQRLRICDTPEECQGSALDVAVGADGRVYILDPTKNVVRVFQRKQAGS